MSTATMIGTAATTIAAVFDLAAAKFTAIAAAVTAASQAENDLLKASDKRDGFVNDAAAAYYDAGVRCAHLGHEGIQKNDALIAHMDAAIVAGMSARQRMLIESEPATLKDAAKAERTSAIANKGPRKTRIRRALADLEGIKLGLEVGKQYIDYATGKLMDVVEPDKKDQIRTSPDDSPFDIMSARVLNALYSVQQMDPDGIPEDVKCDLTKGANTLLLALKQLGISLPK